MLIGASLLLVGVVLLVMTHDLRHEEAAPGQASSVGWVRPLTFWWAGVAMVAVGGVLAASSLFLV